MDLLDIFWNLSQDETLDELADSHADDNARSAAAIQRLQDENRDLRIKVSVLVCLLVRSGHVNEEEFRSATAEAQAKVAATAPRGSKPIQKPPMDTPLKPIPRKGLSKR